MPNNSKSFGFGNEATSVVGPARGNYYLFVIAIDDYEKASEKKQGEPPDKQPRFRSLKNPVIDASRLVNILIDNYSFDNDKTNSRELVGYHGEKQVIEYNTLRTKCLYNENATGENITKHLLELPKVLTKEDCLLIYFSGHGDNHPQSSNGCLIPYDGIKRQTAANTWYDISWIYNPFKYPVCQDLLIILDCCFAGQATVGVKTTVDAEFCRKILVSSSSQETADDGRPGEGSSFANSLQFVLKQNASTSSSLDIKALKNKFELEYMSSQKLVDEKPNQQIIYNDLPMKCGNGDFIFQIKDKDRPQPDALTQSFIKDLNFTKQKSLLEEKFDMFDDAALNLIVTRESDKYVHELLRGVLFSRLCQWDALADESSCMKLSHCARKSLPLDATGQFDVWQTLIGDTKTDSTTNPKSYATTNILWQLLDKPMFISFYSENLTKTFTIQIISFCKEFTEQLEAAKKIRADAGHKDYYHKLFFVIPDSRNKGEDFFKEEELSIQLNNNYNLFINTPVEELAEGQTLDWFGKVKQSIGAKKIQDLKPEHLFPKKSKKKYLILDFIYKVCENVNVDKSEVEKRILN